MSNFNNVVCCILREDIEETVKIMLKDAVNYTNINDIKRKLKKVFEQNRPMVVKLGLDPTAPNIHLGHSIVLKKAKQLQNLGHMVVIIIGDYTAMIGDPSGRSKTRNPLSQKEISISASTYKEQVFKIIDEKKTQIRFNSEWLKKLKFSEIIKLASKCTVARMLERNDFNDRYKKHLPLAMHELFYPLIQAYDSIIIQADVELGGTDQTFNILMGRNMQKSYGIDQQIAIFMPIIEGIDGVQKMSKSLGNYIGIDEPANMMYEKIMSIPDNMILKYYKFLTDTSPNGVKKVELRLKKENPRDIKMNLAFEITKLYHNKDLAKSAQKRFEKVFQRKETPDDITTLELSFSDNNSLINQLFAGLMKTKKFSSKSDIRRIFKQGGVCIDNKKIVDISKFSEEIEKKNKTIVKLGKKNIFKVILSRSLK
ncbi:MAG: tyrosine--tRNA ligase [Oscillospiraceae bacterium]|nr:tyrosine--tRNA ligase [Oscillospiraceae bacterium]